METLWASDLTSIVDAQESDAAFSEHVLADPVRRWRLDETPLGRHMMVSQFGLPQGRMPWAVRRHPNVVKVFSSIYGADTPLCCGMDTVFFTNEPAPVVGCDGERVSAIWPHIDQNPAIKPSGRWDVYQGVVYLWGAIDDCSTTVVWPGSHKMVKETSINGGRRHFVRLPDELMPRYMAEGMRVQVPAGAMLLWNSRTVHQ